MVAQHHRRPHSVRAEEDSLLLRLLSQRCDDLAGNNKDVCVKEAKAAKETALADAKAGKKIHDARTDAADQKRDADYKVATEKCDALAGDAKSNCIAQAKANFGKS